MYPPPHMTHVWVMAFPKWLQQKKNTFSNVHERAAVCAALSREFENVGWRPDFLKRRYISAA
jgi:hypothetical protein